MCWGSFNNVSDLISDFVACYQVEQRVNFVLNDTNPPSLLWVEDLMAHSKVGASVFLLWLSRCSSNMCTHFGSLHFYFVNQLLFKFSLPSGGQFYFIVGLRISFDRF